MRRRIYLALGLSLVAISAVAFFVASRGAYSSYPVTRLSTAGQLRQAPPWTRDCRPDARFSSSRACVRVSGRVVWVQHHDPDGDGDRHVVVLARFHLRVVKVAVELRVPTLPGRGRHVTAIGFDQDGSHGDREIHAARLTFGRRTYRLGSRIGP